MLIASQQASQDRTFEIWSALAEDDREALVGLAFQSGGSDEAHLFAALGAELGPTFTSLLRQGGTIVAGCAVVPIDLCSASTTRVAGTGEPLDDDRVLLNAWRVAAKAGFGELSYDTPEPTPKVESVLRRAHFERLEPSPGIISFKADPIHLTSRADELYVARAIRKVRLWSVPGVLGTLSAGGSEQGAQQ